MAAGPRGRQLGPGDRVMTLKGGGRARAEMNARKPAGQAAVSTTTKQDMIANTFVAQ